MGVKKGGQMAGGVAPAEPSTPAVSVLARFARKGSKTERGTRSCRAGLLSDRTASREERWVGAVARTLQPFG